MKEVKLLINHVSPNLRQHWKEQERPIYSTKEVWTKTFPSALKNHCILLAQNPKYNQIRQHAWTKDNPSSKITSPLQLVASFSALGARPISAEVTWLSLCLAIEMLCASNSLQIRQVVSNQHCVTLVPGKPRRWSIAWILHVRWLAHVITSARQPRQYFRAVMEILMPWWQQVAPLHKYLVVKFCRIMVVSLIR